jgi:hypothetical protein
MPKSLRYTLSVLSIPWLAGAGVAAAVDLYDATQNSLPDQQGWKRLYYNDDENNPGDKADASVGNGVLIFDTLTNHEMSLADGYFTKSPATVTLTQQEIDQIDSVLTPDKDFIIENLTSLIQPDHPNVPVLDRTLGFVIRFTLRIAGEAHAVRDDNNDGIDDRAGYSMIVVSDDPTFAIELGFWDDEVWAYDAPLSANGNFTHAEGAAFDTTAALRDYVLTIQGNGYTLTAANPGGNDLTLSGDLRDYTIWAGVDLLENVDIPPLPPLPGLPAIPNELILQPYKVPNLMFFGDDTSSAESSIELVSLSLEPLTPSGDTIFGDGFELTSNLR